MPQAREIPWGPVKILRGSSAGAIGDYDDDDVDGSGKYVALVYLGTIFMSGRLITVPHGHIRVADTNDLLKRSGELSKLLGIGAPKLPDREQIYLLHEYRYIQSLLAERMFQAQFRQPKKGRSVFISHSSTDKDFVRVLAVDLADAGYKIWFDEWEITAGESIPAKIAQGLSESDALILVLSEDSTASRWVEAEWQSIYWSEIETGGVMLLPVRKEKCKIPTLLKHRKYADFASDYSDGLEGLLRALGRLKRRKRSSPQTMG
jgi:hypothetical protein